MEELLALSPFLPQQSQTLDEARKFFATRYHRDPPKGFDGWFSYAKNKNCVIDNYDWIDSDLAPFRALMAKKNSTRKPINQYEIKKLANSLDHLVTFTITPDDIKASVDTWYFDRFREHLSDFTTYILNTTIMFVHNERSEPRVVPPREYKFKYKNGPLGWSSMTSSIVLTQNVSSSLVNGSLLSESATGFQRMYKSCAQHSLIKGFDEKNPRTDHSFFGFGNNVTNTEKLVPVFGQARVYGCYADIQMPSHYTIGDDFQAEIDEEERPKWEDKKPVLFWRGSSTGQVNTIDNWRQNHRIQNLLHLQQLSATYPNRSIIDVGMIGFVQCDEENTCEDMTRALGAAAWKVPRWEHWQYKYLLVNDGNVMASRLPHFLYAGALVFLTSIFQHNWEEWLVPWVHYVPVRPDLSNLEERLQWAWANDDMAQQIAKNGRQFATRYISQNDLKCWTYRLLLDYNELFEMV